MRDTALITDICILRLVSGAGDGAIMAGYSCLARGGDLLLRVPGLLDLWISFISSKLAFDLSGNLRSDALAVLLSGSADTLARDNIELFGSKSELYLTVGCGI